MVEYVIYKLVNIISSLKQKWFKRAVSLTIHCLSTTFFGLDADCKYVCHYLNRHTVRVNNESQEIHK